MLRDFNHPYLKEAEKSCEGPSNFDLIKGLFSKTMAMSFGDGERSTNTQIQSN